MMTAWQGSDVVDLEPVGRAQRAVVAAVIGTHACPTCGQCDAELLTAARCRGSGLRYLQLTMPWIWQWALLLVCSPMLTPTRSGMWVPASGTAVRAPNRVAW